MAAAKAAGAKRALPLPVSVPSHCALMKPAADKLAVRLAGIDMTDAGLPVIQNVDAAAHTAAAELRDDLARQLYNPVRRVESVQAMAAAGVTHVLECGPGKVLVGLNKRIDKGMTAVALLDADSIATAVAAVRGD